MTRKRLLIGSIIVLGTLLAGTFILMFFLLNPVFGLVEKNDVLFSGSFTVQGNSYQIRGPASISVSGTYVASFAVSEGVIKFHVLDLALYQIWQEGKDMPFWVEAEQADYRMSGGGLAESSEDMYFLFVNEDSYEKEVDLKVARVWHERNYLAITAGIALISIGMLMGTGLRVNKLQLGYLACTYLASFFMMLFLLTLAWDLAQGHFDTLSIISSLQWSIALASLPLGGLVYLWLEKGGGLAHLESWNMGKKLRIVGFSLFFGVLMNVALLTIDALMFWNLSSIRVEIEHGVTRIPNLLYFGLFGTACILILGGIAVFSGLWLRKSKPLA
jgi:hypothetical protein